VNAAAAVSAAAVVMKPRVRLRAPRDSDETLDTSVCPPEAVMRVESHVGRWTSQECHTSAVQASLRTQETHAVVVRPEDTRAFG
jgi:hypothetical protein